MCLVTFKPCLYQPYRGSKGAAGYDITSIENTEIKGLATIRTGLFSSFPNGWVGLIRDRSSMALAGLHVLAGVIDSDYRGEWKIILQGNGIVLKGQRIAQVVFVQCWTGSVITEEIEPSERGSGGFGSTGK